MHVLRILITIFLLFHGGTDCPAAEATTFGYVLTTHQVHHQLYEQNPVLTGIVSAQAYFSEGHTDLPLAGIRHSDLISQSRTQGKEGPEIESFGKCSPHYKATYRSVTDIYTDGYTSACSKIGTFGLHRDLVIFNRSIRC